VDEESSESCSKYAERVSPLIVSFGLLEVKLRILLVLDAVMIGWMGFGDSLSIVPFDDLCPPL
jgi:hypothetical protein